MRNLLRCCVSLSNNLLSFEHRECYCADVVWQHSFFMKTINLIVPRGWHELYNKRLRYCYPIAPKQTERIERFYWFALAR